MCLFIGLMKRKIHFLKPITLNYGYVHWEGTGEGIVGNNLF
nr:MAG TPA: hypothetical protein [Caudoviricetes sp.]